MKERAKLKKSYIDNDLFDSPKMFDLMIEQGASAGGALVHCYLLMGKATNAIISKNAIIGVAERHKVKDPESFFTHCLREGLIQTEGNGFSNQHPISDQEANAERIEKNRLEAERKKRERMSSGHPADSQPDAQRSGNHLPDIDIDSDNDLVKLDLALSEFQEPKIAMAINRWRVHRRKVGKPFDQMALDSLMNLYRGRASELPDDIDHSISNGWKTLNAKSRDRQAAPKPAQEVPRPVINNYKEPTAEEKRKPTEAEKARVRELISKSLGATA